MVDPIPTILTESELYDKPDTSQPLWWPDEDMPGADDEPWREAEHFPRGKYFIGDPCLAFPNYQSFVDEGVATDVDGIGRVFWVSVDNLAVSTDEISNYCYDSMAIGIVPVDHLTPGHWAALKMVGRLIKWDNGGLLEDENDDDWESATFVGIDFMGNVFLGNDWWFTYDFLESDLFPSSLSHLKPEVE